MREADGPQVGEGGVAEVGAERPGIGAGRGGKRNQFVMAMPVRSSTRRESGGRAAACAASASNAMTAQASVRRAGLRREVPKPSSLSDLTRRGGVR